MYSYFNTTKFFIRKAIETGTLDEMEELAKQRKGARKRKLEAQSRMSEQLTLPDQDEESRSSCPEGFEPGFRY